MQWNFLSNLPISTTRCSTVNDSTKIKCTPNKFVTGIISTRYYKELEHIPNTGEILSTTSSNQNNTVLLQIVSLSLYISHEGFSCCELHSRNFSFGRVRLLGRGNDEAGDNALALRAGHKEW